MRPAAVPEGFTAALAALDAVPVVLFCLSSIVLGRRIASPLFVVGSVVAFAGGAGKVAWKALLALARRDVPFLARQMRYVMPLGFALLVAGAVMACSRRWCGRLPWWRSRHGPPAWLP